jgi:polyferredoxin
MSMRKGFAVDVIKDRGALARVVDNGEIENVYRLQIMNGTEQTQQYSVRVSGLAGLRIVTPAQLSVEATGIGSLPVRLTLSPDLAEAYRGRANPIVFEIETTESGDTRTASEKSVFFVPR